MLLHTLSWIWALHTASFASCRRSSVAWTRHIRYWVTTATKRQVWIVFLVAGTLLVLIATAPRILARGSPIVSQLGSLLALQSSQPCFDRLQPCFVVCNSGSMKTLHVHQQCHGKGGSF